MGYTNDFIAHVITYDYGFYPIESTKFEPDSKLFDDRCFLFANVSNDLKTLVKFDPFGLVPDEP